MKNDYSHQLTTGISFGLTTAVITSLGMIVGLYAATASKLAVISGIVIMAIADGLSDAMSLHTVEEAETEKGAGKHSQSEIWLTTLIAFLSVAGWTLSFVIPIIFFPLNTAIVIDIIWGISLLTVLNFFLARSKNEKPIKLIMEHVALAVVIIIVSRFLGDLLERLVK